MQPRKSMMQRNVEQLGQVFTPSKVVDFMLDLCRNTGRVLEPSAGDGAFFKRLTDLGRDCVGIELDGSIAPTGVRVMDFFDFPEKEQFSTIIGNPPYVRYQDVPFETRFKLDSRVVETLP